MTQEFYVGIDTGGTYTDAVVVDPQERKVLAAAKALTTKGDLAVGVREAMMSAFEQVKGRISASQVAVVSVSTTLATNAVVEGHGNPAAAVLIGFDDQMTERTGIAKAFPGMPVIRVSGGHDHNGDERTKLDVASIERAAKDVGRSVSAFAVASSFAVRNAAHETQARDIIERLVAKPVTLSTELSTDLDAPRRALTAVLNARLISRVTHLITAVRQSMTELGITCPLMIVRGDGSLALADVVASRPIETILSGPAASLVGAKWISGRNDFIMSDIGGTTTDVGVVRNGRPRVAPQGAEVGGWRTMVKAIDVKTIGLGGDSEVQAGLNGVLSIGPQRAVPISLIAARYAPVIAMLDADLAETDGGSLLGKFVLLPFAAKGAADAAQLSAKEVELLEQVTDLPIPLRRIAVSSAAQRTLASLRKKGLVQVATFTPSDAAHVLGMQNNWSRDGAALAAKLLCRFRSMKDPDEQRLNDFCQEVWSLTVTKSARIIVETALAPEDAGSPLIDAVCEGHSLIGLAKVSFTPSVPIVAVGGPARVFYEEVGRRLGAEIVFGENLDVANAVGAAAGLVLQQVVVRVEGDGSGLFRVFDGHRSHQLGSGVAALELAETLARTEVSDIVRAFGAEPGPITVSIQKAHLPDAIDDQGLLSAVVTAEAQGRPARAA